MEAECAKHLVLALSVLHTHIQIDSLGVVYFTKIGAKDAYK